MKATRILDNGETFTFVRSKIILAAVADRAIKIDDLELNKLMMRLTLYDQADPESKNFNQELFLEYTE